MVGDALRDLVLVELAAVAVDHARRARERRRDPHRVRPSRRGRDPGAETRRRHDEPDVISAREVPRRERRDLVHPVVERRAPRRPSPQLDARVEEQPDHVPLFALHLAHDQLPPPRARLPRDSPERVPGDVIAQLAQLVPFAREGRHPPRGGHAARTPAARRHDHRVEREGEHLDAVRVREHERHFVEPLAAGGGPAHLERHPVQTPAPYALRPDRHVEPHLRPRRQVDRLRLDRHLELARRHRPHVHAARVVRPAVPELCLQSQDPAARRARDPLLRVPHHLEPGRPEARHSRQRRGASDRHREDHRPPERGRGRRVRGHPDRDDRGPRDGDVERRWGGVELHARPR